MHDESAPQGVVVNEDDRRLDGDGAVWGIRPPVDGLLRAYGRGNVEVYIESPGTATRAVPLRIGDVSDLVHAVPGLGILSQEECGENESDEDPYEDSDDEALPVPLLPLLSTSVDF